MAINSHELDKLASLAHLELTPEERAAAVRDLNAIIGFVDRIKAQEDPAGVPSTPAVKLPLSFDSVRDSLPRSTVLESAPLHTDEAVVAPPLEPSA
jgi:aspartyl/glutamyl-tRNA(Asn/Gln) amidotransferase C subunit